MPYLSALVGAAMSVLAFPPFGLWPLVVVGPALWLWGLRQARTGKAGLGSGLVFGITFFGGLIWWISELGSEAVVGLVLLEALFPTLFGWLVVRLGSRANLASWWVVVAAGWGVMELIRHRFPVGGFEWGAWGYALSDVEWARAVTRWIGTSGWTVAVMAAAAGVVTAGRRLTSLVPVGLFVALLGIGGALPPLEAGIPVAVSVVQGSTPCPFEHCADERLLTYHQHLALTKTIPAGRSSLVVWSEGSTGSSNADPVNNPEVGEAIGAEAARLGAWMVVGGDRPVSETQWVNANVVFDPTGEIVGEYRKRHPVPFGEYIPARPLFDWIPALNQVPRDMIPGEGPVVFGLPGYQMGTVISFEASFARYPRQTARAGAGLLVVATNEGSYGRTAASDQFIGMTRMRSAETGLDVVHAAVTGKSVLITDGGHLGDATGLGTIELLTGEVRARPDMTTVYVRFGDWVTVLMVTAAAWVLTSSRPRRKPGA